MFRSTGMSLLAKRAAQLLCAGAVALSSFASFATDLGAYRWDAPNGPANVDGFSQWLGRPVDFAAAFEANDSWDNISGPAWQLGPWAQWVRAQTGRNLSLAVPLLPVSGATLDACSSGQYDTYFANLANNLAYYGLHWAYLRLGWEMDGGWYAWGAPAGSGKEASYAGCFRRVVQVMRQAQPANQWKFVWNPTTAWWNASYLDTVWPGDAYVDVVAIDLYDQSWVAGTYPYPTTCDATCRLSAQQTAWNDYSWKLNTLHSFAVAHGKPMGIPEWGVAIRPDGHGGGDNPYFVQKMSDFIHDPANNVVFHSYFDVSAGDIDARLTDSVTGDSPGGATRFPNAAALYKQLFAAAPVPANTAPTVSVTSPTAGQTVSGTVAYAASATDNAGVARVDFFLDATALLSDTAAPYGGSFDTVSLVNGTHTLKAVAYDAQGLSATSQVSINVQNSTAAPTPTPTPTTTATPPPGSGSLNVWFKAPTNGKTVSGVLDAGTSCYVKGTGVVKVQFFLDSTLLNTDATMADGMQCQLDTTRFANGRHSLKATAYSSSGATRSDVIAINIQNSVATTATPAPGAGSLDVWFKAPLAGSTVSGSLNGGTSCYVKGVGVVKVAFFLDSTFLNTDATMGDGMQCALDTTKFANGTHSLKATAYDSSGNARSDVISINIQNNPM